MCRNPIVILILWGLLCAPCSVSDSYASSTDITDTYEIYFGPLIEAIPGDPALLIPIRISVSEPTVGVNILLSYDPSLLTPTVVAPNMFFQNFDWNISQPGRLQINLLTDLPPPPYVPPIEGDTIFAWIICCVTSEDYGYDILTHLVFYEDPNTPYPDNSLLLDDGTWVMPPLLSLIDGDILIIHPLYGDINLNEYPFEIGDAITFLNYFMGETEFNVRQYANSDCNQDGIQATIADLVYLLGVITGGLSLGNDSPIADPLKLELFSGFENENSRPKALDNYGVCDIVIDGKESLGGAYFILNYDPDLVEPVSVLLDDSADFFDLSWRAGKGKIMIAVYDRQYLGNSFSSGKLFSIFYSGSSLPSDEVFRVAKVEFSNDSGFSTWSDFRIENVGSTPLNQPTTTGISIFCYPNPFNGPVSISYNLPDDGYYDLIIYDILGREVKSLATGYRSAGPGTVIWDGADRDNRGVASGIYLARLRGEDVSVSVKLFMIR